MIHAGHSIVVSGSTVGIGLLSMVILPIPFIRSIGIGGLLIPTVSVIAALHAAARDAVDAGHRINRVRVLPRRLDRPRPIPTRALGPVGAARHPPRRRWWPVIGLVIVALLLIPALSAQPRRRAGQGQARAGPGHHRPRHAGRRPGSPPARSTRSRSPRAASSHVDQVAIGRRRSATRRAWPAPPRRTAGEARPGRDRGVPGQRRRHRRPTAPSATCRTTCCRPAAALGGRRSCASPATRRRAATSATPSTATSPTCCCSSSCSPTSCWPAPSVAASCR